MKRSALYRIGLGLICGLFIFPGCSRDQGQNTGGESGAVPDYREMIAKTRTRQEATANLEMLRESISRFQYNLARFPTNLIELVRAGYVPEIPKPPPGMAYSYSSQMGDLNLVPVESNAPPPTQSYPNP